MSLSMMVTNASKALKLNAPEILTALGAAGVVSTAYLAGRASFAANDIIRHEESIGGTSDDPKERIKARVKLTWRLYVPAGASGAIAVGCIVGAAHASNRKTAAAVTAYSLSEKVFSEYKAKVIEEIGEGKEQKIRDQISAERVSANPVANVLVTGRGEVLCCELFTGRYFKSDMETLRKAENAINHKITHHLYVTLDEFYDEIGLPNTRQSDKLGWDSDKLLELEFTTTMSQDDEPCIAFDYNYTKPL